MTPPHAVTDIAPSPALNAAFLNLLSQNHKPNLARLRWRIGTIALTTTLRPLLLLREPQLGYFRDSLLRNHTPQTANRIIQEVLELRDELEPFQPWNIDQRALAYAAPETRP